MAALGSALQGAWPPFSAFPRSGRLCFLSACLVALPWTARSQIQKCHPQCKTCHLFDYNLEWHCLECQDGYRLWVDGCFADCPAGQYRYGYECQSCTDHCSQCVGPMIHECTLCDPGYKFDFRSMCVPDCSEGTYPALDAASCESCDPYCRTCIAGSRISCLSCYTGYVLRILEPTTQTGECMQICPKGYYRDAPNDLRCIQCARYCLECDSAFNCLQCQSDATLYRGRCYLLPATAVQTRISFDQYLNSGAGKLWDDKNAPTWEMLRPRRALQESESLEADFSVPASFSTPAQPSL